MQPRTLLTLLLAFTLLLIAAPQSVAANEVSPESELAGVVARYLVALPPHSTDAAESAEDRGRRMQEIAREIALASMKQPLAGYEPIDQAAALIVNGKSESEFARYVGERRCQEGPPGMRCDPDRNGVAQADSYWQLWKVACPKLWAAPAASREALREAATCASSRFRGAMGRCTANGVEGPAGGFAGFHSSDCWWPGGKARAARFEQVRMRLRTLSRQATAN
jgi:hypothetical protein